ncbi:MAG: UDP-N-acetylglucosamine 2-epimerase (non-hydrolyzing) [Dermatophilaceae bacterium]
MPRVMLIYGTRPEAIKMAPLVDALTAAPRLDPVVAVTGQHREMLDQVNELFGIAPDFDLDLMRPGASLTTISTRALTATSELLAREQPDAVVVQGDTTSAFIAALAAFYQGLPVVHLEAGLRTGNIRAPFPEEANRRLIAPLAALHLAPTPQSRDNLLGEGICAHDVVVTGNTVIDALQMSLRTPPNFSDPRVGHLVASGRRILLVTSHRRESWGDKMAQAMGAVREVALRYPDLAIVLPMHRNPVVRQVIEGTLGDVSSVLLTEPLDYHSFTHLLSASHLVLTDSGGVQEEAPSLGKPVLVMRDTTERPEGLVAGTVRLVGTDHHTIVSEVSRLLDDRGAYQRFASAVNPYGDGRAAARGAAAIAELLGVGQRTDEFVPGSSVRCAQRSDQAIPA